MSLALVATGGTIASLADPASGAVRPAVAPADLLRAVPGLDRHGPVAVTEVARVNGWNMTPATMLATAAAVEAALAGPADGAIVTAGTDTVEETAFLLDLVVASDQPVVVAAAMRSGDELGADGPRNLACAAAVASDPAARGLGAVLVMNDEVHAARFVRKQDAFRPSAFASPGRGPLGLATPAGLELLARPGQRWTRPRPPALDAAVPVVQTYTGMEEGLLEAVLAATGARGLVVEGTGLGNVPGGAVPGIRAAVDAGLPVVVATRVPTGGTRPVYGGPGGGVTLRDLGVLEAGLLPAAKARLLLMLLLAGEVRDVRARFAEAVQTLTTAAVQERAQ